MLIRLYLFFICLFIQQVGAGQSVITGKVITEAGQPLAHATITAENPADSAIVSFATADANGLYKLIVNTSFPKLLLRMRLINYATQFVIVDNKTLNKDFITHSEAITLQEVIVRPGLIMRNGDTLSYDADAFAAKQDRTLADVLKKLPGVDVSSNGQISVQNEPINKFYVEGKDLMGGRYGAVTNSMPNRDVARIEVLNNHQPIKMLQGKIPSIQPAINIRLKKAVSYTGRAGAGAGASPFLWTVSATPMWFTKKQQALLTYKTNNTGDNVPGEMNEHFFIGSFEGKTVANNTGNRLSIAGPVLPPIPLQRYLFNNVHSVSANALSGLGKDWELRLNTYYVNDLQTRAGGNTTEIRTLNTDGPVSAKIEYLRRSELILQQQQLNLRGTVTKNVKQNFLKNVFAFRTDRNFNSGPVYFDNDPLQQRLYSPGTSFQNSFSVLLPLNTNKTRNLNVRSFINYIREKQDYYVQPAAVLKPTEILLHKALLIYQQLGFRNFEIEKDASVAFRFKKITWVPSVKWVLQNNLLNSALHIKDSNMRSIDLPDDWRNDIRFTKSVATIAMALNFDNDILRISVNLPLSQYQISARDKVLPFNKHLDRILFEPTMFLGYKFHPFWNLTSNAGIGNSFSTIDNLYPGFIFSGLGFMAYRSEILRNKNQRAGFGISYKNNLNNIFGNLNYNYSLNLRNIIISRAIEANGLQTLQAVLMNNVASTGTFSAQMGKYFNDWHTNLQLSYSNAVIRSNVLLNKVLLPVKSRAQNFEAKVSNNNFDWTSLEYNFSFAASKRNSATITTPSKSFLHGMSIFFYPLKNNTVSAKWDNAIYKLNDQRFENNFLDMIYQYNLQKRKMDFEIKFLNILNTQTYRQVTVTEIETRSIYYTIRPRQFLFSVKFNLR